MQGKAAAPIAPIAASIAAPIAAPIAAAEQGAAAERASRAYQLLDGMEDGVLSEEQKEVVETILKYEKQRDISNGKNGPPNGCCPDTYGGHVGGILITKPYEKDGIDSYGKKKKIQLKAKPVKVLARMEKKGNPGEFVLTCVIQRSTKGKSLQTINIKEDDVRFKYSLASGDTAQESHFAFKEEASPVLDRHAS
jgi:hypothetical protein